MKSIKNTKPLSRNNNSTRRILTASLCLVLTAFVLTITSSSFLHIKPVSAAPLGATRVIPTSNIVNERATYDIFLTTATTGTIKTIEMKFPFQFDVSQATLVVERSGIGFGTLSAIGDVLKYTVSNPVSVPAVTTIKLEIGRIINSNIPGTFAVELTTLNPEDLVIDGPTFNSVGFPIKDIGKSDISKSFVTRSSLDDDKTGHAHGWDPNGVKKVFDIVNIDNVGQDSMEIAFVPGKNIICIANGFIASLPKPGFQFVCDSPIPDGAFMQYMIFNALRS